MPLDDGVFELINSVIDGEATPDERARLDTILAASPEAQHVFEAAKRVAARLDEPSREEPPAAGRSGIMAGVARAGTAPRSAIARPSGSPKRKVWFGVGWAAVAAIVVALVALAPIHLIGRRGAAGSGATMAPPTGYDTPAMTTIRSKSSSALLVVRRDGDLTVLEPVVESPRPVVVSVTWDAAAATAVAISGAPDASSGKGQFSFTHRPGGGRGSVVVRPNRGVRSVEVTVSVDSHQVIRAVVPLG